MTREAHCSSCQALIDPAHIDTQRELASCGRCGRLTDLRRTSSAAPSATSSSPRARPPVQLPVGMSFTSAANVVIRRRWLRPKHWLLLALFAAASAYVAQLWASVGVSGWLVVGTLFVVSWNFNLAAMFLNSTVVTADARGVNVRHGPFPSLFARRAALQKEYIDQLYSSQHGARFAVLAKLKSGQTLPLVAPLVSAEQALFVEQQLEKILGLSDFPIAGELGDARVDLQGKPPPGAASGTALVFAIPLLIAGILGVFLLIAGTEVSGRLQAKAGLGSWAFSPDDCSSGQREGFSGVVLTAPDQQRVIRALKDPIRGNLVVVASAGQPNHVLSSDSCRRFEVNLDRTNTSINDIWVMDGSLVLECAELSGSVTFEGCH